MTTTLSAMPAPGTVVRFLTELRATGSPVIRLRAGGAEGGSADALPWIEAEADRAPEVGHILADWHREAAEDLGGPPLAFEADAARQGARLLFRAAWCYLQRGIGRGEVAGLLSAFQGKQPALVLTEKSAGLSTSRSVLSIPPGRSMVPEATAAAAISDFPATAAAQFSADLTLRHLPAVFRMAQTLAPGDPLLPALQALAARFPLSGPGAGSGAAISARRTAAAASAVPPMASRHADGNAPSTPAIEFPPPANPEALENLLAHPGLRQLFLDRILTTRSRGWLRHPRIAEALLQSLGGHAQSLAPGFLPAPAALLPSGNPTPAE